MLVAGGAHELPVERAVAAGKHDAAWRFTPQQLRGNSQARSQVSPRSTAGKNVTWSWNHAPEYRVTCVSGEWSPDKPVSTCPPGFARLNTIPTTTRLTTRLLPP